MLLNDLSMIDNLLIQALRHAFRSVFRFKDSTYSIKEHKIQVSSMGLAVPASVCSTSMGSTSFIISYHSTIRGKFASAKRFLEVLATRNNAVFHKSSLCLSKSCV